MRFSCEWLLLSRLNDSQWLARDINLIARNISGCSFSLPIRWPSSVPQTTFSVDVLVQNWSDYLFYLGGYEVGRRWGVIAACGVFSIGVMLEAVSTTIAVFAVGRVVAGLGVGLTSCLVPMYQSECAPSVLKPFCLFEITPYSWRSKTLIFFIGNGSEALLWPVTNWHWLSVYFLLPWWFG